MITWVGLGVSVLAILLALVDWRLGGVLGIAAIALNLWNLRTAD